MTEWYGTPKAPRIVMGTVIIFIGICILLQVWWGGLICMAVGILVLTVAPRNVAPPVSAPRSATARPAEPESDFEQYADQLESELHLHISTLGKTLNDPRRDIHVLIEVIDRVLHCEQKLADTCKKIMANANVEVYCPPDPTWFEPVLKRLNDYKEFEQIGRIMGRLERLGYPSVRETWDCIIGKYEIEPLDKSILKPTAQ